MDGVVLSLLIVSIVVNVVFVFLHYKKFDPYLTDTLASLSQAELEYKDLRDLVDRSGCKRVYSKSGVHVGQKILVCTGTVMTREEALSECSKFVLKLFQEEGVGSARSVAEIEGVRGLFMRTCMELRGFEY